MSEQLLSDVNAIGEAPAFPMRRTCPFHPPVQYAELRKNGLARVTLWDGSTAWLATSYDDIRQVLRHENFSAVPTKAGYPFVSGPVASLLRKEAPTFISMDAPDHTRLRRMLTQMFAVRRMEEMRPRVQGIAERLIDAMAEKGGPLDFVENFALPYPSLVISELLGVPYEDHDFFQECSRARMDMSGPADGPVVAGQKLATYIDGLMRRREADPGGHNDLLTRLVVEQVIPGNLSRADAVAMARLMLVAGHETTASVLAYGLFTLLRHPEQWAALKADEGLIPGAVEEMLRFTSVTQFTSTRVAIADCMIGGQLVRAGEGVLALVNAANRDPAHFPAPDEFNSHRDASNHIAFSDGPHQCLGQPLARLELRIALAAILRRMPNLRVAVPDSDIAFKHDSRSYSVESLPVSW